MDEEDVKDLRLMFEMVSRDCKRLGDDLKVMYDYLMRFASLMDRMSEKENNVEYIK